MQIYFFTTKKKRKKEKSQQDIKNVIFVFIINEIFGGAQMSQESKIALLINTQVIQASLKKPHGLL